mmetsp:Transcript_32612/g.84225  ORF Transcript_32612/g.84225 Transcript_32612/m.84225 type:complete len:336 (-) Transcript_32612:412-1419(-)
MGIFESVYFYSLVTFDSLFGKFTCIPKPKDRVEGKVYIVTGGNGGIGKEISRGLAERGAHVIIACRSEKRGVPVAEEIKKSTGNPNVEVITIDLSHLRSVREFVQKFNERGLPLHGIVNNAGVMACPRELTEDRIECQLAINHMAHYLLANLLLPNLMKSGTKDNPSRIVALSSVTEMHGGIDLDDINFEKGYSPFAAYSRSKQANVMFVRELQRLLNDRFPGGSPVIASAVHPGVVLTDVTRSLPGWLQSLYKNVGQFFFRNPEEGARSTIYAATAEAAKERPGEFYFDGRSWLDHCSEASRSLPQWKKLWEMSASMTGLKPTEDIARELVTQQ